VHLASRGRGSVEGDKSGEAVPTDAPTFNQVRDAGRLGIMALRPLDALLYRDLPFPFDRLERLRLDHLGRSPLWRPNPCRDGNRVSSFLVCYMFRYLFDSWRTAKT
jgi:hypothetical protein